MDENFYIGLIQKKCSGELNAQEEEQLNTWLAASDDNRLLSRQIEQTWEHSGNFDKPLELDMEADFLQLQKRLDVKKAQKKAAPVVPINKKTPWLSIAAGALVLIVAGFLINNYLNPSAEWLVATTGEKEQKTITLVDGTEVTLNENSELRYPSIFTDSLRQVEFKGKAVFDVTSNPEQPFNVKTHSCDVRVLGTQFMIHDYPKLYYSEVAVAEGQVRMQPYGKSKFLLLNADQKGYYQKSEHKLSKREKDSLNSMSWFSKRLRFNDTPLKEVLGDLRLFYGAQVYLNDGDLMDCPFTGDFKDQPQEDVILALVRVFGFTIEELPRNSFRMSGGNCQ